MLVGLTVRNSRRKYAEIAACSSAPRAMELTRAIDLLTGAAESPDARKVRDLQRDA